MPTLPPDLIQLLSGNGPEVTGEIANVLRRRQQIGQLGALSGDKVLSPLGGQLMDETNQYTEQLSQNRDKAEQRRILENWHQAQERMHGQEMGQRMYDTDVDALARLQDQQVKPPRPVPVSLGNTLTELGGMIRSVDNLLNARPFQKEWESRVPGERTLRNWAARNMPNMMPPEDIEAQAWQAEMKNGFELAMRHSFFGATLTPMELAEFRKAAIGDNFNKEQVDNALKKMKERLLATANSYRGTYSGAYGDEEIASALGLPPEEIQQRVQEEQIPDGDEIPYEIVEQ